MNLTDIANNRLINQQIVDTRFETARDLVGWMGAMQAQDYAMAKWAVGVRLPNATDQMIETAVSNGEIIRTHLLRPTWHFVTADNIYWMLELTAPQIKSALKSRHQELELSPAVLTKSNSIIEKALRDQKHLTRTELIAELEKANIATDKNRASHLFMCAESDGIICSGTVKGNKQTYALLAERVPLTQSLTKEEALAKLAEIYFTSHGPATLHDFAWWSGLLVNDAKHALEMVKSRFISETIDAQTYWFTHLAPTSRTGEDFVTLLPAFDEFIISYRDRTASLPFTDFSKAVSNNGIFRPIIVVNGQVIGIWKRTLKKDQVIVEPTFFKQPNQMTRNLVENVARQFGRFLEKETAHLE